MEEEIYRNAMMYDSALKELGDIGSDITRPQYQDYARSVAQKSGIPEELFLGLLDHESIGWNRFAKNPKSSATGLGQHLDRTLANMGQSPTGLIDDDPRYDPYKAIDLAAEHLLEKHKATGNWHTAVKSYGEGALSYLDKVLGVARRGYNYLSPSRAEAMSLPKTKSDPALEELAKIGKGIPPDPALEELAKIGPISTPTEGVPVGPTSTGGIPTPEETARLTGLATGLGPGEKDVVFGRPETGGYWTAPESQVREMQRFGRGMTPSPVKAVSADG